VKLFGDGIFDFLEPHSFREFFKFESQSPISIKSSMGNWCSATDIINILIVKGDLWVVAIISFYSRFILNYFCMIACKQS
jgi:hypothetical protein